MSFRLTTLLWPFALIAASVATFGPGGIVAAGMVVGFWLWIFYGPKPTRTLAQLLIAIAITGLAVALLLPDVQSARPSAPRYMCKNNLKQIALALHNYHDVHGQFPPPYIADASEKPMHSWRVHLLPQIELQSLYDSFDLAESWDSPINRRSSALDIYMYRCPNAPFSTLAPATNYFAVVGSQTAWPESGSRAMNEITDDTSRTVLLVEARDKNISWAEPKDLSFDDAVELLTHDDQEYSHIEYGEKGLFYRNYRRPAKGINVAMVNGDVLFLPLPLTRDMAIALLTANGGESIDQAEFDRLFEPQLDYTRIYSLCVFVILGLLPGIRLLRLKRSK